MEQKMTLNQINEELISEFLLTAKALQVARERAAETVIRNITR